MENYKDLNLQSFYPSEMLKIISVTTSNEDIIIKLKSITHSCVCPKCGKQSTQYHGTYRRKVQDLPILGKRVLLDISSYEYKCENIKCSTATVAEDFQGFLNHYSRMTERCADFICTLAMESSCEGAARICNAMGIKISGDSVIRLLIRRFESQQTPKCGSTIGIDDFAYKKRHTYCTIVVDEKTHEPVAVLDGRDGKTLREWLKSNKQVKAVTRDRAGVYAKVISEELPSAMQVADRFHLHQNLLEAVKKALGREVPATVKLTDNHDSTDLHTSKDKTIDEADSSIQSKKKLNNCG